MIKAFGDETPFNIIRISGESAFYTFLETGLKQKIAFFFGFQFPVQGVLAGQIQLKLLYPDSLQNIHEA